MDPPEGDEARPGPTRRAAPVLAAGQVPLSYSVSAYSALVGCPYKFFARHVLRLNELDEVSEEMEKRDYGLLVHEVLECFHKRHPVLTKVPEDEALASLQEITREVFARALEHNFLALGWRLRWEKRLTAYLAWQRQREESGWYWHDAETKHARSFPLDDGVAVELHGRIDRTDTGSDGYSLLDYKTRSRYAIKAGLEEDLQLAAYAALVGEDAEEAAYVVLDDDKVEALSASDDLQADAKAQAARLVRVVEDLRTGAPLPAHGAEGMCAYCEMAGLCRHEHVDEMNVTHASPAEVRHD
jgi:ATP-dependent helicase/nuclease subunit B